MVAWSDHVADVTLDELHVELMYIRSTTTPSTSSAQRRSAGSADPLGPGMLSSRCDKARCGR